MSKRETILARAAEIIAQRTVRQDENSYGTLITIDPDGAPVPTTISPWSEQQGCRVPELSDLPHFPYRYSGGLHGSKDLSGNVVRGPVKPLYRSR